MALKVLFFGTPAFAATTLARVIESTHSVVGVVTQPDRPRGRGQHVQPEAVKALAASRSLPILQPTKLRDPAVIDQFFALAPDIGVVAAYGRILPDEMLRLPSHGFINVHASLLPRWRGAAPVHRAILAGDRETGVTIMRVVSELDAGPMIDRVTTPIDPEETSDTLEARLAVIGANLLVKTLDRLAAGESIVEDPQDDGLATYASRLERRDGRLDWARPAPDIHNQIRGLHPWPLAETRLRGRRVLLHRSTSDVGRSAGAEPGTILRVTADALEVAARPGVVNLHEVQLEGRKPLGIGALLNGWPLRAGDRFEPPAD